jgi:uncharacterized protein (DUF983 family)
MGLGDGHQTVAGEGRSVRQAFAYLRRAALLNCPVCGTKPIFKPWRNVRSFYDWFTPLDGCPRCGYPYEREPGYFLLAIFGFNYGFGACIGMAAFIGCAMFGDMANISVWTLLLTSVLPVPIINVLIARHAKALFIALDHFVDPFVHEDEDDWDDDDDDGSSRLIPDLPTGGGVPPRDKEEDEAVEEGGVLAGAGRDD